MKCLLIYLGILIPIGLFAQFEGGYGDGQDVSWITQVNLKGVPQGDRPLFAGSFGDGFSYAFGGGSLADVELATWQNGGRGDGFSYATSSNALSGEDLSQLFHGSDGDGFASLQVNNSLDGVNMAQLFGGGEGEGHDMADQSSSLNGILLSLIYNGGTGDGFDHEKNSLALDGTSLELLYAGGSGDGFDMEKAAASLSGTQTAALYTGGYGEGHDASTFSGAVTPFPVAYLSFDAYPEETFVLLQWVTESELNNQFFTIERSQNGVNFEGIQEVPSKGSGEEIRTYEAIDPAPYPGVSYYRLRQTDYNGEFTFTDMVEVLMEKASTWDFVLSPNPNDGRMLNIDLNGLEPGTLFSVMITDLQGRSIFNKENQQLPPAINRFEIDLHQKLAAGSYVVKVMKNGQEVNSKILLVQ